MKVDDFVLEYQIPKKTAFDIIEEEEKPKEKRISLKNSNSKKIDELVDLLEEKQKEKRISLKNSNSKKIDEINFLEEN